MKSTLQAETLSAVEEIFSQVIAEEKSSGMAWALSQNGEILASGGVGSSAIKNGQANGFTPAPDSISRIASMSKSFTAATILALRDEGKLRLDDEVSSILPAAKNLGSYSTESAPITIRHLLTMSAGLVTDNPWGDRQESMDPAEFAKLLENGLFLLSEPGTRFEYSNTGYVILGEIISYLCGRSYREEINERFIRPLGMTDTVWSTAELNENQHSRLLLGHRVSDQEGLAKFEQVDFDSPGVFGAMAGLFSTAQDVTKWAAFLSSVGVAAQQRFAGNADGSPATTELYNHLLSPASRREMQEIHRLHTPVVNQESGHFAQFSGYGYGLVIINDPVLGEVISHSGGYPGYGSFMAWERKSGLTVTVLANSKYAPAIPTGMAALKAVKAQQPELLEPPKAVAAKHTEEAFATCLKWLREAKLDTQIQTELVPSASEETVFANRTSAETAALDVDQLYPIWGANMDQDVTRTERLRIRDKSLEIAGLNLEQLVQRMRKLVSAPKHIFTPNSPVPPAY